jgi:acyl-CoA thioesterase II
MSGAGPGLVDVLTLERIEADLFRSSVVHSLHGYFLSRGDPSRRVLLMVNRDRDGRSYSNRRVIAVQNGVVIFNFPARNGQAGSG